MLPQRVSLRLVTRTLKWPMRDGDEMHIIYDGKLVGSVDIALIKAFLIIELQRLQFVGQFDMQMRTARQLIEDASVRTPVTHVVKKLPHPAILKAKRMSRRPKSGQSARGTG